MWSTFYLQTTYEIEASLCHQYISDQHILLNLVNNTQATYCDKEIEVKNPILRKLFVENKNTFPIGNSERNVKKQYYLLNSRKKV